MKLLLAISLFFSPPSLLNTQLSSRKASLGAPVEGGMKAVRSVESNTVNAK